MGLIAAAIGAVGGVLADQWKEFFYCEALDMDVLVTKGQKRITGRSSNTKGNDNIISNGSGIAVADGQCMIIVEQGKVVEVCAEPGQYTYDTSTEPSIFSGKFGKSLLETFKLIGKRFAYGGDTGKDQRVYYFNTKDILENKFGTANPIPFRVVDNKIGLDIDVSIRCNGVYSYRLANPLIFYSKICGNVEKEFLRSEIDGQLKTEFINALQPAMAKISDLEIRPNAIPAHVNELGDAMRAELAQKWLEQRGIEIVDIALNPVTLTEEDQELIKTAQRAAMLRDPNMAAATIASAQADAMKAAASNPNGAANGFIGYGMANQAGGMNPASLFQIGAQQAAAQPAAQPAAAPAPAPAPSVTPPAAPAAGWICSCGATATGKFCPECGSAKPAESGSWTCSCGAVNTGKFCSECGAKKPEAEPSYRCSKCGWEPEDAKNPPKFCPECGDPFGADDVK